jgi:3-oxoacyl-[acyl-carrier protein] reductase
MTIHLDESGLDGRVALIVGGTSGIGEAAARALARQGARLAIVGRSTERVRDTTASLRRDGVADVIGIAADVATADGCHQAIDSTVAELGVPGVLVDSVGNAPAGALHALTDDDWELAWSSKVLSTIRLARLALPLMRAEGGGTLITVAGHTGWEPHPDQLALGVVNAALFNLTHALAREGAPHGVRCCAVAPGPTRTGRFERKVTRLARASGRDPDEVEAELVADLPAGRPTEPSEVGALIAFLASSAAAPLNGAVVPVEGALLRGVH